MDEDDVRDVEATRAVGQVPLVVLIRGPVDGDSAGVEGPLSVIDCGADDPAMLDPRRVQDKQDPFVHVLHSGGLEQAVGNDAQVLVAAIVE